MGLTEEKTIYEIERDEQFTVQIQDNLQFEKNFDKVLKYANLNVLTIKPNSVVEYLQFFKKNYNERSLLNLLQNEKLQSDEQNEKDKKLKLLRKKEKIKNINNYSKEYEKLHKEVKGKPFKILESKSTANKIYKITSVFTKSVISRFSSSSGFKQRSITFATFTLTDKQKHTDEFLIRTFVDFIDHLKKVKNKLICPIKKIELEDEANRLKNYVWRAETQENGNIHFHLIADTFLNQYMLRRVWNNYLQNLGYKYGYGAANVQSLQRDKNNNKIKSVERYLCKYMTKLPLTKKAKTLKSHELINLSDEEKYRRPVIGKRWGCSKSLLKLEYPKFYQNKATQIKENLKKHLREYVAPQLPEFIKVFVGDTKEAFKKLSYKIQRQLKEHYLLTFQWLYEPETIPIN